MVETLTLKAEKRCKVGTRSSRKCREAGLLPVVVYGHGAEVMALALNAHDVAMEVQHHHRLLDVEIDGKVEKLFVKDIQYDYLFQTIIHMDLIRVNLDERVTMSVPIELRGTAPGTTEGGVLDQVLAEIEVECLVTSIPKSLRGHIDGLGIGDSLLVQDIELPEGVTLISEPTMVVAAVHVVAEEEEEPVEASEDSAEPEVIGGKPDDEEEGDDA